EDGQGRSILFLQNLPRRQTVADGADAIPPSNKGTFEEPPGHGVILSDEDFHCITSWCPDGAGDAPARRESAARSPTAVQTTSPFVPIMGYFLGKPIVLGPDRRRRRAGVAGGPLPL